MEHENILKVQSLFEENGTAYYVMDYIDGESLGSILKRRGSLPENEAVAIIQKVASALDYMHKQNRFHLDVKPANIMLRRDGKVLLIDFGSSKQYAEVEGENTTTLAPCYTPGYAPTEQMNPKPTTFTAATDVYALGATLYKMLTGMTPPSAIDIVNGEETLSPLPNEISKNVKECIAKAMIPQRNLRVQSIAEFVKLMTSSDIDEDDEVTILNAEVQKKEEERLRKEAEAKAEKERSEAEARAKAEAERKAREEAERKEREEQERKAREEEEAKKKASQKSSSKTWLWVVIGAIVVVGAVSIYYMQSGVFGSTHTYTANGVSFEMVKVEGGTFTMGATSEMKDPWDDEKPSHQVTLSSYSIGQTEVTQALWKAVMGSNPSSFKGDNLPVECVSWNDCKTFISKLNSLTDKNFRLPTEAEWEFAARGGNNSKHYQYSGSNNLGDVAWYDGNSGSKTHAVATKQANELGIYDMSGNVWEWCSDWYGNYSSSSQTNPTGPNSGTNRVIRGGSWDFHAGACRSSNRLGIDPGYRFNFLGLRLCLSE